VPAQSFGLSTVPVLAQTPADLDRAFQDIVKENCDALFVLADPERPTIMLLAATHKIPALYQYSLLVDAGGLASYGANVIPMFSKAAQYVDKVFKGADPANLPAEQPSKFEFVLNLKTAKALGLTIPDSILARADKVIDRTLALTRPADGPRQHARACQETPAATRGVGTTRLG
jgi:putative ABC transport system substrate-binding protein